ncbi:MAG TPA: hypothetical protein VN703_02470 [Candidatus Sulfopaludibacter sp.]|nr:hypothetical protein [Candidatus Sulfopaludibacter sp.]
MSLHVSGGTPTSARAWLCKSKMTLTSTPCTLPVLLIAVEPSSLDDTAALLSEAEPSDDEPLLSVVVVEPLLSVDEPPPVDESSLLSVD